MVIGSKYNLSRLSHPIQLFIGGDAISRVNEMKYLGVMIDQNLDFSVNHRHVCKKIAFKTNFLLRNCKKLDMKTKLLFYKSVIQPHFQYCATILFLCNQGQLHELQVLQNRCMRIILNCDIYTSINFMLEKLDLLDVVQILNFNVILTIYKASKSLLPSYLCENLSSVSVQQPYNLRNNNEYRLPFYQRSATQNSLFYNGVNMFNQYLRTSNAQVQNQNTQQFKTDLKQYVKSHFASH